MGLVRTGICVGLMGISFYAGYKTHERVKPPIVIERAGTIEDKIISLMKEDKKDIERALYNVGKEYGFEK